MTLVGNEFLRLMIPVMQFSLHQREPANRNEYSFNHVGGNSGQVVAALLWVVFSHSKRICVLHSYFGDLIFPGHVTWSFQSRRLIIDVSFHWCRCHDVVNTIIQKNKGERKSILLLLLCLNLKHGA